VLGSAGGPQRALRIIGADTFFIVNGDTLTDLQLAPLADAHAASQALVTLALVPNREPDRYGGVLLDEGGQVTGFARRGATARGSHHFIGVQLANAEAFASVADDTLANTIGDVYDRLLQARPGSIRGVVTPASFLDIGTVADYWHSSQTIAGRPLTSIVWDDVQIAAGATLDECIVTDGVRVESGDAFRRAILIRGEGGRTVTEPLVLK
jgi:NDP-sugar pyrophosphorylase family protein